MTRFLLTRVALLIVGPLVASILIFLSLRVFPGDVAQLIAGSKGTPEQVAQLREQLGLNAPLWEQYAAWIGGIFRGDLGTSLLTGSAVTDQLAEKAQVTVPLALMSMLVALLVGVPFGVLSALGRGRRSGSSISFIAQALASVPVIWAGMLLVIVFALWLQWLPAQGFPRGGWSHAPRAFASLVLPALTIGVVEGAVLLRFVRSATLQAMTEDYVRTAAAQGLTRTRALVRDGLPNVAISIISILGLQFAGIVVGAVVVEKLFNLPGIGRMLVTDVGNRDLPMVQGEMLTLTVVVLVIGVVMDIVHRLIDPRLREAS
ncbi:ABC transporter permease [Microbacterium sp. ZW T5_56]|uniref:ABC transporter permease n=1 Tax=Microbacterium sp. ZW T5_56 TaxID=3378081 RepID=UPI003853FF07